MDNKYSNFAPYDNEDFDSYKLRIYKWKYSGKCNLTWNDISSMFYLFYSVDKDESTWRKESKSIVFEGALEEEFESETPSVEDNLKDLILEFKKERVKISDERTQNNAYVRRIAREETLKEIALEVAKEMSSKKLLPTYVRPVTYTNDKREGIIQISDWHYGIEVDNFLNKFNPEICASRVSKLLQECKAYFGRNPVSKLYVVNLGDLIAGRIHSEIRIESRYDVVTQCIHTSEMLAEFLNELTSIAPVDYYDCLDNHSRVEPNKKESLDLESLARITPWYLKNRFENNKDVTICYNDYSDDIINFKAINGKWSIGGVHGHKDKPAKVVDGLTLFTRNNFDLILTAHLHHFSADEKNQTVVLANGSLMGTDRYASDYRLSSIPSQNLILVNEKTPIEDIHRVVLNY